MNETDNQKRLRLYKKQEARNKKRRLKVQQYYRDFPKRGVERCYKCMERMEVKGTLTNEIIAKIERMINRFEGLIKPDIVIIPGKYEEDE